MVQLALHPLDCERIGFVVLERNVFIVRVEVVAAGAGVNVTVLPDGWPVRLRVTDPLNPLIGVIVTV